jgi:hypothetical protein
MFWIASESSAAIGPIPEISEARDRAASLGEDFLEPVFIYIGSSFFDWAFVERVGA